ncbi:DUF1643 domain-containing protein [Pirellulimonas nuda]|uniref:DUF1643 domain-containing protein n=1 Tax=Pirellulimonas nuda TaxID=2528009 RepID=UPI0011A467B0
MKHIQPPTTDSGDDISQDRCYRYRLWRRWGNGDQMTFIGLNPSKANETVNDHTIRKCMGFARRHSCEAIQVLNLFALRESSPDLMRMHQHPFGPRNDQHLIKSANKSKLVVACWGARGRHMERDIRVSQLSSNHSIKLMCFGLTVGGFPRDPRPLSYTTTLVKYA